MKNNAVEFANKLNQFCANVRRFSVSDLIDGYTPIHDMVGSIRSFFVNYKYAPIARGVCKLTDKFSLSIVANAHDNDDEMEGAAWLEIAVIKNGHALVENDEFINIRYNDFLAVIRAVAKSGIRTVGNLLFQLVKYEYLAYYECGPLWAEENARRFVESVKTY